jgi:hypothetical protein
VLFRRVFDPALRGTGAADLDPSGGDDVEKVLYKVVGILGGVVAAKLGRSAVEKAWMRTHNGEDPPRNPAVPGTSWNDAVMWAVASGIAAGIARLLATKGAASAWAKGTGHLPPGLEEVGN